MNPTEILVAYSQDQASVEEVVRALISYDEWLVDVGLGIQVMATTTFDKMLILSTAPNIPPDQIWLFTDEAAAMKATDKGAAPGSYVGFVPGTRLFSALAGSPCDSVQINIGSEPAKSWFIGQDAFALMGLWANAISLEALLNAPDSSEKFTALRDYIGYTYLVFPEQDAVATAQGAGGLTNPAMVFTAPDCAEAVMKKLPQLERHTIDGHTLFARLPSQGVDGVIFNPLGPGPQAVFDLSVCEKILSSAA